MGEAPVERLPSLRRNQVSGRTTGVRGCAFISRSEIELTGTGMGPNQDGRRGRAGRYRQGAPDPGLVGDERRTGRNGFPALLLPPEPPGPGPRSAENGAMG